MSFQHTLITWAHLQRVGAHNDDDSIITAVREKSKNLLGKVAWQM